MFDNRIIEQEKLSSCPLIKNTEKKKKTKNQKHPNASISFTNKKEYDINKALLDPPKKWKKK